MDRLDKRSTEAQLISAIITRVPSGREKTGKDDPMKPSEILFGAADLLEARHLVKGSMQDGNGGFCQLGAISEITQRSLSGRSAVSWAAQCFSWAGQCRICSYYVNRVVGGCGVKWNNAPERTKEEVVAVLREAGHLARLDEQPDVSDKLARAGGEPNHRELSRVEAGEGKAVMV